jgi:hypothetical protein
VLWCVLCICTYISKPREGLLGGFKIFCTAPSFYNTKISSLSDTAKLTQIKPATFSKDARINNSKGYRVLFRTLQKATVTQLHEILNYFRGFL